MRYSVTQTEPDEQGIAVTVIKLPARRAGKADFARWPEVVATPSDSNRTIFHHSHDSLGALPEIIVGAGIVSNVVQVTGLQLLVDYLAGGNLLAGSCASPQKTDITLPSLPARFRAVISDVIVYEKVSSFSFRDKLSAVGYTPSTVVLTVTHRGLDIKSIAVPVDYLPIAQALRSIARLRDAARSLIPELLAEHESLMPSSSCLVLPETKLVRSTMTYEDFATSSGTLETKLMMLDKSTVVAFGKKPNKQRNTVLHYEPVNLLAYVVDGIPNHVVPHLQITKFAELAKDWMIYPSAYYFGLVNKTPPRLEYEL